MGTNVIDVADVLAKWQRTANTAPEPTEVTDEPVFARLIGLLPMGSKVYVMGLHLITLTPPDDEGGWWMSVSHPHRLPHMTHVARAKAALIGLGTRMVLLWDEPARRVDMYEEVIETGWIGREQVARNSADGTGEKGMQNTTQKPTDDEMYDFLDPNEDDTLILDDAQDDAIPEYVIDCLGNARLDGTTNMLDREGVIAALRGVHCYSAALWLEQHADRFGEALIQMGARGWQQE
jgi:hypothetical protein